MTLPKYTVTEIQDMLTRDEGFRLKPYTDTKGKLTIGIGRNLTDRGLSRDEVFYLVSNDIDQCEEALNETYPWWSGMTKRRQMVLLNMCFNLGITNLKKFKNTMTCMKNGEYVAAAEGMMGSLWAKQVGDRARRLSIIMIEG